MEDADLAPPASFVTPEERTDDKAVVLSAQAPLKAVQISFHGLKRVSPSTLLAECQAINEARTVGELQAALAETDVRLRELQLFRNLRAHVTVDGRGGVDVDWLVDERPRTLTMGGNIDNRGEASADLRVVQPGILGGPVGLAGTMGTTVTQARDFSLSLFTARLFGHRLGWSFNVASSASDEKNSSYQSEANTVQMRVRDASGAHAISAEMTLRDLFPLPTSKRWPSIEVQTSRLRSFKTSLSYSFARCWLWGSRSKTSEPTPAFQPSAAPENAPSSEPAGSVPGAHLRAHVEAAGFFGDARFLRGEASGGANVPLPGPLLGHLRFGLGALKPLDSWPSCMQDRFYLGGASGSASLLKGFAYRSLGPIASCALRAPFQSGDRAIDALGGHLLLNSSAAISTPVALPGKWRGLGCGARLFAFSGVGTLAPELGPSQEELKEALVSAARASYGIGLSIPVGDVTELEFTIAKPFWALPQEMLQRWQAGFRVTLQT